MIWEKKSKIKKLKHFIKGFNLTYNNDFLLFECSIFFKCSKNTEHEKVKSCYGKKGRTTLSSKCAACGSKKLHFLKSKNLVDY